MDNVPGISFNSEDELFLKFNVVPGVWEFNADIFVDYPPEISFTTPSDGTIFEVGVDELNIELDASDDQGLQTVELYLDDQLIGTRTVAPFNFSPSDTPALVDLAGGNYTLTATATDTDGKTAETSINISVLDLAAIFTTKLMFYLPLENNGDDLSGNDNHATMGSAVTYATGKYGDGGVFSYTEGSYFTSVDNIFEYSGDNAYTIAFWLKVSDYTTRGDILQPNNGRTLLYSVGDLSFRCSHQQQSISFNVDDAEKFNWFHVALVLDQRAGQRQHKFYIDGQQQGSIAEGYEFETGKPQSFGKLIFGSFSANALVRNFTGMLDEVYMFNDVLSEAEINEVMNIQDLAAYLESLSTVENEPTVDKIKLFPNPANQTLNIVGVDMMNAKVYDLSGRMIKSVTVNDNQLNVSSFQSGVYFIKMIDVQGNSYTSRFVKQ